MGVWMNRRGFLQASGAALAAAALVKDVHGEENVLKGRIKKAVKFYMVKDDLSVLDKFKLVQDLGYDSIEPTVSDSVDAEVFLEASQKTGLPIHGVVNGSVDDIPGAIDRAVFLGADSVLLVAGRVSEEMGYAENYTKTQEIIREALPYAAEKKIMLLVENVWNNFLLSPLEMARYIDELDSPWLGVYFDIGNVVRFAWPEHWIPVLGNRIKKLDVKEYSRDKQNNEGLWKGFNVKIGEGSIDWAAVRRELVKIDYRGWATAEVSGGDRDELADVFARMDTVLGL